MLFQSPKEPFYPSYWRHLRSLLKLSKRFRKISTVALTSTTKIRWTSWPPLEEPSFEDLVIYQKEHDFLFSWIKESMIGHAIFQSWSLDFPQGCIVWGKAGVGKTNFVRYV